MVERRPITITLALIWGASHPTLADSAYVIMVKQRTLNNSLTHAFFKRGDGIDVNVLQEMAGLDGAED